MFVREQPSVLVRWTGMPYVLLYLVVEIVAVVAAVSVIGFGATVLVLLAGAVVGLWLARREGVRAAQAVAAAARRGGLPHVEITDGLLVAAAGVLLFVPGLVTDVLGLLLLVPPVRGIVRRKLVRAAEERSPQLRTQRVRGAGPVVDGVVVDGVPAEPAEGRGPVIEGTVVDPRPH